MEANQLLVVGVSGPELSPEEAGGIRAFQPGGFALGETALVDVAQVRRLTDQIRGLCDLEPLIVLRCDARGVWPARLLEAVAPTPASLRDRGDPKLIMTAAWIAGRLLRILGINVHLSPDLTIGSWGRDDQELINNAGTFNRYQRRQGILGAGFSFPGGTSCAGLDTPALLRGPLLPFTALMPELDAILIDEAVFPHIDSEHPASRSPLIIQRLLRDQLGYKRLVLADTNDPFAILAGADLIIEPDIRTVPETLSSLSRLSGYTLSDAVDRIEYARRRVHKPAKLEAKTLGRLEEDALELDDRLS